MKVWPGKLYIDINRWYDDAEEAGSASIEITNTESYEIDVAIRVDKPSISLLDEGYTVIPDTSWIKTDPEILTLGPGDKGYIDVYIEVPKSVQPDYNNEKWEVFVVCTPPLDEGGGINIQTEIAVKLFIRTPDGEAGLFNYIPIVLIVVFLIIILLALFYNKKKKFKNYQENK